MRSVIVGFGAFVVGAGVAAPGVAQERTATPAVLSAAELTSIRSLVSGTPQWSPDGSRIMFGSPLAGFDLWTVLWAGGPRSSRKQYEAGRMPGVVTLIVAAPPLAPRLQASRETQRHAKATLRTNMRCQGAREDGTEQS